MMKESPLNRDEMTGGLSGIAGRMDGIIPSAPTPTGITGLRMPERLTAVRLTNGRAEGLQLPALSDREVVTAWRKAIRRGPLYVRCTDRVVPLPIEHIQRLARLGELWLDGAVPDPEAGLDLLVAGAHRIVVWLGESTESTELLETFGDSAVVGWDGTTPWLDVVAQATMLGVPVVCAAEPPGPMPPVHVYRIDLTASGASEVVRLHAPEPAKAADEGAVDDDADEADDGAHDEEAGRDGDDSGRPGSPGEDTGRDPPIPDDDGSGKPR